VIAGPLLTRTVRNILLRRNASHAERKNEIRLKCRYFVRIQPNGEFERTEEPGTRLMYDALFISRQMLTPYPGIPINNKDVDVCLIPRCPCCRGSLLGKFLGDQETTKCACGKRVSWSKIKWEMRAWVPIQC
jgi:hypothetical protein